MKPGLAELYACPYCGKTKAMFSMLSGNTFNGEFWSDFSQSFPMYPIISKIQRCPHCSKFSFFYQWENLGKTEKCFGTTGKLDYDELKDAYKELSNQPSSRKTAFDLALSFVHAYNDEFRRPKIIFAFYQDLYRKCISEYCPSPDDSDVELFVKSSQAVIDYSGTTGYDRLLKAEMHRERGEWLEAYAIIVRLKKIDWGDNRNIVDSILSAIERKDSLVIPFVIGGWSIDRPINFYIL